MSIQKNIFLAFICRQLKKISKCVYASQIYLTKTQVTLFEYNIQAKGVIVNVACNI